MLGGCKTCWGGARMKLGGCALRGGGHSAPRMAKSGNKSIKLVSN